MTKKIDITKYETLKEIIETKNLSNGNLAITRRIINHENTCCSRSSISIYDKNGNFIKEIMSTNGL